MGRLNLTKEERAVIAEKINEGVPFDIILDSLRDKISDIRSPVAVADKQDLSNIVRDFNPNPWKDHTNNVVSVHLWYNRVTAIDDKSLNPVIFYKRQGEVSDYERLDENCIILVIANEFQRQMLIKFGNNIICTDSNHSTNEYDFYLTTIVVVDLYGTEVPVTTIFQIRKTQKLFQYSIKS